MTREIPGHSAVPARCYRLYGWLMAHRAGRTNDSALAAMLATHYCADGGLPSRLGLQPETYSTLLAHHFPGVQLPVTEPPRVPRWDPRLVEEKDELIKLMLMYRAELDVSELWMSQVVATACMAGNHLWQDLGLWSRTPLSELMNCNFPTLAAKNDRDMKWKKFLYKQLCIQEGIYICRAPSCEVCSDYPNCFGPEQ